MSRGVPAGRATIETGVYDKTAAGIKKIKQRFKKMSASLSAMSQKAALGAASIGAPLALAAKSFVTTGDKIDKLTKRTGLSVAAAQSFGFAMEQSGSSMEALEPAIKGLNRNFLDFKRGSKEAVDNFGALGISFNQLSGLDTAERMRLVLEQISKIPDEGERAAVAAKVLGKSGTAILPLLGNLEELEKEFNGLGDAMSEDQVAAAAKLSDSFNILNRQFKAIVMEVGSALAPMLQKVAEQIKPFIMSVVTFIRNNPDLITGLGKTAVALGTVAAATKLVSMAMAANPFGLMVTGIVAAVAALPELQRMLGLTKDKLNGIGGFFGPKEKDLFRGKSSGNEMANIRKRGLADNERRLKSGEIDQKEYDRIKEAITGQAGSTKEKEERKKKAEETKKKLEEAAALKAAESQKKASEMFSSVSKNVFSKIKGAASVVGEKVQTGAEVAASALGVAGNFLQANTLQPALNGLHGRRSWCGRCFRHRGDWWSCNANAGRFRTYSSNERRN